MMLTSSGQKSSAAAVLLFAALSLAGAAAAGVSETEPAQSTGGTPDAPEPAALASKTTTAAQSLSDRTQRNIWWNNQLMIETLALSQTQRDGMNALLKDMLEKRRDVQAKSARLRSDFLEAVEKREWDRARTVSEEISDDIAEFGRLEGRLKVDVLSMFSVPQLEKLVAEFPRLVQRPWLMGGTGGPMARRQPGGGVSPLSAGRPMGPWRRNAPR